MKKTSYICLALVLILSLCSCRNSPSVLPKPEQPNLDQPDSNSDIPSVSPQKGEIKTFEYDGLVLTVSNVREIKQGTSFDGMETWTYDIYVVYPGAMVTVLDATMMHVFVDALI